MKNLEPTDRFYLLNAAQILFPNNKIDVIHMLDEIIHIDVNGHRYTFQIGSDDDAYVFTDGKTIFEIPLMDFDEKSWDLT